MSIDIRHAAKLARIALSEEEERLYGSQLGDLLEHVKMLERLDVTDVPATAQVVELRNVMRSDEECPPLDRETLLSQAPQRQGPFVRVPRIIAE